ncbi:MAG: hypothetical protein OXG53_01195 [Chloroflexi bacterium]|nr:hypothetical protein [Chloroflexota bacterium]
MPPEKGDQLALVRQYRQLVEAYEALDSRIDELVTASRGEPNKMSAADLRQYREWARKRTELLNDMRLIEQQLDLSGDDAPSAD